MRFSLSLCATAFVTLVILTGCGSAPPEAKSAAKEIAAAESALEDGKGFVNRGQLDQAATSFQAAKQSCADGLAFAAGNDADQLRSMDEDIRAQLAGLEKKQIAAKLEAGRPKPPVEALNAVDPAVEAKRKAAEAKQKQAEEAAKAAKVVAALSLQPAAPKTSEPVEDTPEVAKKKEVVITQRPGGANPLQGRSAPDTDEDAKPLAPRVLGPEGIFLSQNEASPAVEIFRLENAGPHVFAYFQLYNKSENNKRIMSLTPTFKDKDNNVIDVAVKATFPFRGFNKKSKDLIGDQPVEAITSGSHEVEGLNGLQLISVGELAKPAAIAKFSVKVIYHDNTTESASWPDASKLIKTR